MGSLDSLTLDQIRVFVEVAEAGSFSGAARRLHRAQSAVSYAISNLETTLSLSLFDRSTRLPQLTEEGRAILKEARIVLGQVSRLREKAMTIQGGLEPEVSFAVTALFPMALLIEVCHQFYAKYEHVGLRVYCESLGMVIEHVIQGNCQFGISGPDALDQPGLLYRPLTEIPMTAVVSKDHPLANCEGPLSRDELSEYVQIVITDRSKLTEGVDKGVVSSKTWRVSDLETKHELLRSGLGWGGMPLSRVQKDLDAGVLVQVETVFWKQQVQSLPLYLLEQRSKEPGPAGRWLINELCQKCERLKLQCKQ